MKHGDQRIMNSTGLTNDEVVFVDVIKQLKNHLAQQSSEYPRDIIENLLKQQEYVTPKLLEMLEKFVVNPPRDPMGSQWIEKLEVTALFVLAKFKEPKAFPHVVKLCSLPYKVIEDLLGDIKTEHLDSIIASTFNDNWALLFSLVANQYLNEFVRCSALDAYIILYKNDLPAFT